MNAQYNFETIRKRYDTGSRKWAEVSAYFPNTHDDILPFSVADMEFETAPEIVEGLKRYLDQYVLGYANPTQEFLETVCLWMKGQHSWDIKPEWILNTPGIINALFTAVQTYTSPGDGVLLMTPVYYPMYSAIENCGRVLVESPLLNHNGRYEIDFEDFERKAKDPNTKMLILCSPHNPTGRVWTKEELMIIGTICADNHVFVCSDEIHFDMIMPGHTHTVFANLTDRIAQNCMVCTAPSKTFNLAGLQTSNIIIPNEEHRQAFQKELLTHETNPKCNILGYEANRIAYLEGKEWLRQVIEVIDRNRKLVEDFLAQRYPQVIVTPLEGTYLQWIDFRALGIAPDKLAELLRKEAKLFFDDGFIFGDQGAGFERWNLACPTRYIEEGLERLHDALKNI